MQGRIERRVGGRVPSVQFAHFQTKCLHFSGEHAPRFPNGPPAFDGGMTKIPTQKRTPPANSWIPQWRRGVNVVGRINEVTLRRARLVLGWVMGDRLRRTKLPQYFIKPPRPTQPSTLSGTGNEYQPKCSDAVRLGSKGRYGSFHLWINVWVAGKTV